MAELFGNGGHASVGLVEAGKRRIVDLSRRLFRIRCGAQRKLLALSEPGRFITVDTGVVIGRLEVHDAWRIACAARCARAPKHVATASRCDDIGVLCDKSPRRREVIDNGNSAEKVAHRCRERVGSLDKIRRPCGARRECYRRVRRCGGGTTDNKACAPRVLVTKPANRIDRVIHRIDGERFSERTQRRSDRVFGAVANINERCDRSSDEAHPRCQQLTGTVTTSERKAERLGLGRPRCLLVLRLAQFVSQRLERCLCLIPRGNCCLVRRVKILFATLDIHHGGFETLKLRRCVVRTLRRVVSRLAQPANLGFHCFDP